MHALVEQIEASLASKLYFLSLFSSLSVPDIAGALGSDNGEASGRKFAVWYDTWVRPRFWENLRGSLPPDVVERMKEVENPLDGESCYQFRCSLLHQGSTQHPKSKFARIIFIEPGTARHVIHYTQVNDALCIDLPSFCSEVLQGARAWLAAHEADPIVQRNLSRFVQRHPNGLAPYVGGLAVVG